MVAGFTFMGTELIGLTAGEAENPKINVPKAIRSVFWRIILFYVGSILIVGSLIKFNDPALMGIDTTNIATSPFTLVFERAGLTAAAFLMNGVILSSILSGGNAGIYGASRMLYSLSLKGKAPKVFSKVNKRGVPVNAILLTAAVASLCFLSAFFEDQIVYTILLSAAALTGFIVWIGIAICHYRFRKAYIKQGRSLSDLTYVAKWYPFGPIFAGVICIIVLFGANIWVFQYFTWFSFITNYLTIPLFLAVFLGYKFVKKTKLVRLEDCDFTSGIEGKK
jgi:lysine-specific permease